MSLPLVRLLHFDGTFSGDYDVKRQTLEILGELHPCRPATPN